MAATIKRHIAYKIWIKDLLANPYTKQEGWDPNYVEINGQKISRVNILATAVGKFLSEDGNYGALTLDDGTETIRVKAFGPDVARVKSVEVGDFIRLIGKPKEYNDELYLTPEIVRVEDDPNWFLVRKAELGKPAEGKIEEEGIEVPSLRVKASSGTEQIAGRDDRTVGSNEEESPNVKLVALIKSEDSGDGADVNEIIEKSGMDELDARNLIAGLLKSGDVFEPRRGKLKLLE